MNASVFSKAISAFHVSSLVAIIPFVVLAHSIVLVLLADEIIPVH